MKTLIESVSKHSLSTKSGPVPVQGAGLMRQIGPRPCPQELTVQQRWEGRGCLFIGGTEEAGFCPSQEMRMGTAAWGSPGRF